MGTIYKITDKVWGISDTPWPIFYAVRGFVFIKIIVGAILLCLLTIIFPLLYIFGVWYLIKKKKKPNWLYFALYTGLMGWYIFCIVKYLVLGYPMKDYSSWPGGDKPIAGTVSTVTDNSENMIWKDGELVPFDDCLEVPEDEVLNEPYHYRLTVRDPEFEYEWLNTHRKEQNLEPLILTRKQVRKLSGVYAWDSKIKFTTQAQLLNYLCKHVDEMQKYKTSTTDPFGGYIKSYESQGSHRSHGARNAEDEYNDRLYEYLDDPEDELQFDPEVFDSQRD